MFFKKKMNVILKKKKNLKSMRLSRNEVRVLPLGGEEEQQETGSEDRAGGSGEGGEGREAGRPGIKIFHFKACTHLRFSSGNSTQVNS